MRQQMIGSGVAVVCLVLLYLSFCRTKPLLVKIRVLTGQLLALDPALATARINVVSATSSDAFRYGDAETQNENAAKWQDEVPQRDSAVPIEILDDEPPTWRVTYEESVPLFDVRRQGQPVRSSSWEHLLDLGEFKLEVLDDQLLMTADQLEALLGLLLEVLGADRVLEITGARPWHEALAASQASCDGTRVISPIGRDPR